MRPIAPFVVLFLLPLTACQTTAKPSGTLDRGLRGARMTSTQLNVHMADFVLYFIDSVERASDRITELAPGNVAVHDAALRWKIYTVPAVFSAAFHDDPLASYLDLRIFTLQMGDFFSTGAGRNLFGEHQQIALDTCKDLEHQIVALGDSISDDPEMQEEGRQITESLAAAQPLKDLYFLRQPLDPERIKNYIVEARAAVDVAHDINRNIAAIRRLVAAEIAILPRQATWQTQLVALEMARSSGIDLDDARAQIVQAVKNFDTLTHTVASMPDLVSTERATILQEVNDLQTRTLKQLDAMLTQTQGWTEEQRRVVLEQVSEERQALITAIDHQRTAVVRDVEASGDRLLRRAEQAGDRLIERIFRRLLVLWLIVLGTTILAVLLFRWLFTRRSSARPDEHRAG